MSVQENLPNPEPAPTDQSQPEAQAQSSAKARRRILSVEECLQLLAEVSALAILGRITPNQANASRGALRDILAYHQRSAGGSQAGAAVDSRLLDLLPNNSALSKLVTPLLSEEQVALVIKGATGGNESQT